MYLVSNYTIISCLTQHLLRQRHFLEGLNLKDNVLERITYLKIEKITIVGVILDNQIGLGDYLAGK